MYGRLARFARGLALCRTKHGPTDVAAGGLEGDGAAPPMCTTGTRAHRRGWRSGEVICQPRDGRVSPRHMRARQHSRRLRALRTADASRASNDAANGSRHEQHRWEILRIRPSILVILRTTPHAHEAPVDRRACRFTASAPTFLLRRRESSRAGRAARLMRRSLRACLLPNSTSSPTATADGTH